MKRLFTTLIMVLFLFVLSACNNSNSNTIYVVELSDRENTILSTTSDKSFVFDFEVDSEYEEASVWIEKYEDGELVDDRIGKITVGINESGSITFSNPMINNTEKHHTFNIGIGSNGVIGSKTFNDKGSNDLDNMSSVWGSFPEEITLNQGELVLANISYSDDEFGMSSLSTTFYENPEGNVDELEEYDITYLFKAEFIK